MVQTLRKQYPPMDKTLEKYEQLVDDERIRYEAMSRDKWLHDQATMKEVSYEKGLAEGLAEGKTQGLAEGKAEEKKMLARNLKSKNFSASEIMDLTGLSLEELEKI